MNITVDTNIIFSTLYSNKGASHQILKLIFNEKLKIAISAQVYFEYNEVLTRKENLQKFNLSVQEIEDVLDFLELIAKKQSIYFLL